jgi:ABC-type dipeptide/oligopeptide/nickel transport system permease component
MLFAVMIVNLIVDISYAFLDPRIRYGGAGE